MNSALVFSAPRVNARTQRGSLAVRASNDPLMQKPSVKAPGSNVQESVAPTSVGTVSIEYQRQQAKAMQQYFKQIKLDSGVKDSQVFGWTKKNEISNGRWVMMGLAIGMLTEYATAVNFVDQIKLMVSYLGILDLDY